MNYRKTIVDLIVAAALLGASSAFAQGESTFAKANQEFASGQFNEAVADYESVARSGPLSANLFYNLGNAYFRLGDHGHAILNYERALTLEPRHPEASANLRIARDQARALELLPGRLERLLRNLSSNHYTIVAAIGFWGAAFGIAWLIFARRRSPAVLVLSILSFSIFTLGVVSLITLERGNAGASLAIVTGKNVEARVATADNANSVLALPAGSEIRILSERGDWVYAALPNDLRGWLSARDAEPVRPKQG